MKFDLYLGGDLGLWSLSVISFDDIRLIITHDADIIVAAHEYNLVCSTEPPPEVPSSSIGISIHYPRIIKPGVINQYDKLYNLHPGLLPWGRGYYPVFWALWEDSPAGASFHEITEGVDEGPLIDQVEVAYSRRDTGGSLHQRVREAEKELFLCNYSRLKRNELPLARPQVGLGSYHTKQEFFDLKTKVDLTGMSANKLLKLLRCLSFPGYSGLEIPIEDCRFDVRMDPLDNKVPD